MSGQLSEEETHMPGFDGTGPQGQGPRTGGGFGYCRPVAGQPGAQNWGYGADRGGLPRGGRRGRVFGGGRARGRGWYAGRGRGWYAGAPAPLTQEEELAQLQQQSQAIQQQLADIQTRIEELTSEK